MAPPKGTGKGSSQKPWTPYQSFGGKPVKQTIYSKQTPKTAQAKKKQTRQKPKQQRKIKNSQKVSYDPWNSKIVPSMTPVGDAVAVGGMFRFNSNNANQLILCFTNVGYGSTVGIQVVNGTTPDLYDLTIAKLKNNFTSGGPTSGRAMKMGISMRNESRQDILGGGVYILRTTRRLNLPTAPTAMTQAQWTEFASEIVSHQDCRSLSSVKMSITPHKEFVRPRDQPKYEGFESWLGELNPTTFLSHTAVWTSVGAEYSFPMESMWVVVEKAGGADVNTYEFTARADYYTRWPLDNIMSDKARPVPVVSAEALAEAAKEGKYKTAYF